MPSTAAQDAEKTVAATAGAEPELCFHCSLPIPAGTEFGINVDGQLRRMCCPGCVAVAQSILDRGLDAFYRLPRIAPDTARQEDARRDLEVFDDPLVQAGFARDIGDGTNPPARLREAELVIEGMHCAACAWLIEQTLRQNPAVRHADVVNTTRRARLVWDPAKTRLSELLRSVDEVGYRAWPYNPERIELVEKSERQDALWRLFVAGFGMMQVMMYALPAYIAGKDEISPDITQLLRWAGLLLTVPVVLYSCGPFFRGAWRELRNLRPGMNTPVALGVAAAFGASAWSTLAGVGPVYFDSVAMFVFLLLGGRYLELLARQRAGRALLGLSRLVPETANLLGQGGSLISMPAARLQTGNRVLVRPGETLPADGELQDAEAILDESLLTGESRSVRRGAGDTLTGGAINAGSAFTMRVTRAGPDTVLSCMARLAQNAMAQRPRWLQAADRAATIFVIVILPLAAAAGAVWLRIDPSRALWIAVSVLVVTCPCALSLAAPVALTVAVGEMARRGLVVAHASAVETLARVTDCVFDKTGTLTSGRITLLETRTFGRFEARDCLALAAAVERGSEHPLAKAVCAAATQLRVPAATGFVNVPGQGVEAAIFRRRYRVGSAGYVGKLHGNAVPASGVRGRDSTVWIGDEQDWIALFRLGDEMRPESARAVAALRNMGVRVHILSGDAAEVAARAGAELGVDFTTGEATPQNKHDYIRALQARGACVAMVGDGINDAPSLAQADMSVALAGGADLAQLRADALLMSDSPSAVAGGIALARRTRSVIRQNLAWALGYNLVVLPLAFAGAVTPLVAGVGMSASSILVVANALRLRAASKASGLQKGRG